MRYFLLSTLFLGLAACSSSNNTDDANENPAADPEMFSYRISLLNLTNAQPLSPPVAILSNGNFRAWTTGQAASDALETLAEGGDAGNLVDSQSNQPSIRSTDVLVPGVSQNLEVMSSDAAVIFLTVATMLVNTNDAFTGVTAINLGNMQKGDVRIYNTPAYDAGTEFNDEIAGNIPGPAGGGEGFNAARDDITSVVTYHGGVVSKDDGYPGSALSEADRFDNPVMRVEVTRL